MKTSICRAFIAVVAVLLVLSGVGIGQGKAKLKPKTKTTATQQTPGGGSSSTKSANVPPAAEKCLANGLTENEITAMLAGHNKVRAELSLQPLTWDCGLANLAQDWANQSIYEHRDTSYGENMFVSSESTSTVSSVLDRWLAEKANWNNATGTCSQGKTCTHYTQVVWKTTSKVGCGINRNATGKWKAVLVCNYDPTSKSSGPAY
jgi:pathogenesis-related protein 1